MSAPAPSRFVGWTPLALHAVLVQVLTFAFRPGVAYAALEADAPALLLGLLGSAFAIPALALALPAGRVIDRIGERTMATVGAGVLILAGAVALFGARSVVLLVVSTCLLGIGHLLSVISEQVAVANRSEDGRRESAFGFYTFATSLGQVLGPLLLAVPGPAPDSPWLAFVFTACIGVGVALVVTSLFLPAGGAVVAEEVGAIRASGEVLRSRGVLAALFSSSIALASVDVTLAFWPALGADRALPVAVISSMLVARALATMASRGALPFLARRISRPVLLTSSLVGAAFALAVTGLPVSVAALIAAAVAYGLAIGVTQPITMAWLADLTPRGRRGVAMSLRLVGNRIGQSTLPFAVGVAAPAAGVAGVLLVMAGAVAAAAAVSLTAQPRGSS